MVLGVSGGTAWAQERPDDGDQTANTRDVADLWRLVRHKEPRGVRNDEAGTGVAPRESFFVVAPTIGSKPSTGLSGGLSGNLAFFRGDPQATHISTISGGLKVSQKKQVIAGVKFAMFSNGDRWFFQGDNRLSWTSQNTYGLGADSLAAGGQNLKYDFFRVYETAYRTVRPGLFVGLGLNIDVHSNIRSGTEGLPIGAQSGYATYAATHGFADDTTRSSGTSVGLLFDTRDNAINAQRGWLASAAYRTFFDGFLGGDSTWQELYLDVRTYRKLTPDARHKLAFWFLGDLVTGGTAPYFDLPTTAGNDGRSSRGYGEGRYRGEHLLYGEVEYRGTLTSNGLVGFVAFLNTTTVDNVDTGERLFDAFAPGAGFGFRFLLNKRSRTNLCTDFGWGKQGAHGFYLAIQEAF
jgi:hypothetical protein